MESCVIIKILFVLLLTGNFAVPILIRDEEKYQKPDQRTEELEWITNFAAAPSRDGKVAKQMNDSPLNSLCPSGITGQFPYPPDCKRFVNCWKGRGMIQVCAPGTLFNPATGECDYPDKVQCVEGERYSTGPQPWITRFPVARPPISANQQYSRKDKGNLRMDTITVRPNPGLPPYFGQSHSNRPTPGPTSPTTLGKLQEKVQCPPGSAGLYPHPTDCTRFLNCWGGRMFIQKCGPGTYFNPDMSVCDHAGAFSCAHSELENNGQGLHNEPLGASEEEGRETKESGKENKSLEPEASPAEDFYSAGTNLYDVRAGVEKGVEEQTGKPGGSKEEEKTYSETKKERDPSWGKILNFGNSRGQSKGTTLFYDAHGNPINSNRFWGRTGLPHHHSPKTLQQASPTNHQPVFSAPRIEQQPENKQPHYNIPHSQQNSEFSKPENERGIPGDSNAYYLRPHNHVMNQYPPHLQNDWIVKAPQQSFKIQSHRPPTSNPHHPSAPMHYSIPGHFIFVNDKIPNETRITHDYHQKKEVPVPFLVPPTPVSVVTPSESTETRATDLYLAPEEPSKVLLPPRPNDSTRGRPFENRSPDPVSTNVDYSGWKPFSSDGVPAYNESSNTPHKTTRHPINIDDDNRRMHANQQGSTVRKGWTASAQNVNAIDPKHEIIAATTYRPSSDIWPVYHGNKNPYSFGSRTFPAVTTTVEPTTTTRAPETTAVPNRVYVVYPVKNYEKAKADESIFHGPHPQKVKIDSAMKTQKLKGTSIKKAIEEDLKKRIKSEVDFSDSQEDLSARDVEIYTPTLDDLFPNAKKDIRLKPLSNHLDGYIEMKKPNGEWGLVCDKDYGWMINEANIVCKELGYGRGAQISWQGYPLDSSSESIPVSVSEVTCTGSEDSLKDCLISHGDNGCDITKNAVGLRCFDNVTTQCHPEEVEYNNSCYRIVKRDDIDDEGLTLEEAAEYCNKIGGRISDVVSEEENDFISQWLMEKHPEVRSVLTGGIGSAVMGRSLWMWFGSHVPMLYQNWWKGWAEEKKVKHGTVHEPSCVVLRKSYPCFIRDQGEEQIEVELGNVEPEFCSANYFYWDVEDCRKLRELKLPYLCKKPLEEIGCVVGRGENYSGTASVTSSGRPCLPWDHPSVKEKLAHQITLQEWSTKLSGHNFCRNMGRQELHPWCFVEGKENSEYCSIPQCWDSVPGYSKSAVFSSKCDETHFECSPGECIKRVWFCDGKKDCSNGRDEAMCNIFLQEFAKIENKRMDGYGKEEWPEINENTCAKLCLESKKFKCKSFSYDETRRSCFLSEMNIGLSGKVVNAEGWSYYELSVSSLNCSANKSLMGCKNGKCVNVTNICDGKDNCGDGSDETDCSRIGHEIRLAGSNETNKGRVEVKVLGRWGAVCDDKFNVRAGEVVCRELGFKYGVAEILHVAYGPGENPIFLVDDLECLGNETSIRECSFPGWGMHDCKPEEAVGIVCRIPETECAEDQWNCRKSKECIPIRFLCDSISDCDDGSDEDEEMCNEPIKLRLTGGPNATSGRLEIRYLGTWGTICDDNFNDAAANVICRIFGFDGPSYAFKNTRFGPGRGPIWLDGIQCFGNETNVSDCDHSGWGKHNCKHDEDVSVSCSDVTLKHKPQWYKSKPVAASLDANSELTPAAKVKQVLIRECSDRNGTLESIDISRGVESRARVVGSDVVREAIPWQASVRVRSPGGKSSHWCGAIVITPYHVLTAGHCLRDYSKPAYFIRVGDFDTEVEDPEEQELAIDHLYIHPEFNRKLHLNNDIAMVKVKGEIRLGKHVRPACLAPSTDIYLPDTNCSISGWGSVSAHSSGYARTLRSAYVPILEPSLCRAPFVYGNSLSEGMFCAGKLDGGVDSCQGDSGGPIVCHHEGKQFLYGITSWGHGCGRANKPGVYTNVAYYSQWIQDKILISLS